MMDLGQAHPPRPPAGSRGELRLCGWGKLLAPKRHRLLLLLLCPSSSSHSSSAPSQARAGADTQKHPRGTRSDTESTANTVTAPGSELTTAGRNWERFPCQCRSYWEHWERTGSKEQHPVRENRDREWGEGPEMGTGNGDRDRE